MRGRIKAGVAVLAAAATSIGTVSAAGASVPPGRALVSDAAMFDSVSCVLDGSTVAADVFETPGGGASVWLPNGAHLVALMFTLYGDRGQVVNVESYGHKSGLVGEVTVCTATGTDPSSGQAVTGVLQAVPVAAPRTT